MRRSSAPRKGSKDKSHSAQLVHVDSPAVLQESSNKENSEDDDLGIFSIGKAKVGAPLIIVTVQINGHDMEMILDTGAALRYLEVSWSVINGKDGH